ncbi:MAG: hypothetical protein J6T03_02700, partial [Bacteroidales bacterium]|nr:hypothetical protein [Bacteroidales bacterium]
MNRKVLFSGLVTVMMMAAGTAMGQNDCCNPTMREAKAAYDKGKYRQAEKYYREAAGCYDCTAQQKAQARKQATECRRKIEADEAAKRSRQEEARQAEERRQREEALQLQEEALQQRE